MRKVILSLLVLAIFTGFTIAQEDKEVKKEEKKTIIIKMMDNEGNITTEVIGGDDMDELDENVFITREGDSIRVEVEIEEGDGKRIKKRIVIPGVEGLEGFEHIEGIEGLEDIEKDIHIFKLDSEFAPSAPHMFWMDEHGGSHDFDHGNFHFFEGGKNGKATLGVMIEDAEKGVKVKEVIDNSSAYSIGILAGDVITHIDGKKMTNVEELVRAVTDHKPGDMIDIKLKRNGKTKKFTARLQEGNKEFNFKMPEGLQNGMKKMKHHIYRGIDEFEDGHKWHVKEKCKPGCEHKCTGDKKHDCKKEIIIDKEMKLKEKQGKLEEKLMKMEKEKIKQFEMQHKEKEILEREIEKKAEGDKK